MIFHQFQSDYRTLWLLEYVFFTSVQEVQSLNTSVSVLGELKSQQAATNNTVLVHDRAIEDQTQAIIQLESKVEALEEENADNHAAIDELRLKQTESEGIISKSDIIHRLLFHLAVFARKRKFRESIKKDLWH